VKGLKELGKLQISRGIYTLGVYVGVHSAMRESWPGDG